MMNVFLMPLRCLLLLFGLTISFIAKADSWNSPIVRIYYSENKEYKLVVTPQEIPLKYYEWCYYKDNKHPQTKRILRKKREFMLDISEQDTVLVPCTGELYHISKTDTLLVWKRPLLNDVCPTSAIVANDGSSIATFDNWFFTGYGVNVFVVYNEKGDAKRTYKLEEISPYPLNDYSRSISSIYWRGDVRFIDNERIEILFECENKKQTKRIYTTKRLKFDE